MAQLPSKATASSSRARTANKGRASLNRADGKAIWSKALGPAGSNDKGSGPRGTPTTDGDRLYVLTEGGDLWCLKAADGAAVWQHNILKEFNGRNIQWLLSESPLVDGNMVIVTPGGRNAGMVALDNAAFGLRREGAERRGQLRIGDCRRRAGRTNAVTITGNAAVGVRESDGKLMWRVRASPAARPTSPRRSSTTTRCSSRRRTAPAALGLTATDAGR
jgi:outer membrane protein assembly factor BamB